MAEYSYPASDVDNSGAWTTAPLWSKIEEEPFDDADYVISPKTAASKAFTVALGSVADPGVHTGHVLRIRAKSTGTGTLKFELLQSTTVIHDSGNQTLSTALQEFSFTLSEAEAGNITDYTALRVRVTAVTTGSNKYQWVSWIRLEVPTAITPKSVSDTGAGAEGDPGVRGAVPATDTGSGADALAMLLAQMLLSDTGAGVDGIVVLKPADTHSEINETVILVWRRAKTVSDTGVGAEAQAISAAVPQVDSGVGADTLAAILVAFGLSDTGAGVDGAPVVRAMATMSEFGAGVDAVALRSALGLGDAGSGLDASPEIRAILFAVDVGAGADAIVTVIAPLSVSDSGAGVEATPLIFVSVPQTDAGAGVDEATGVNTGGGKAVADTGAGVEAVAAILARLALSDAGVGQDTVSAIRAILEALSDSGAGIDGVLVADANASILLADLGIGADALELLVALAISDAGSGGEAPGGALKRWDGAAWIKVDTLVTYQ